MSSTADITRVDAAVYDVPTERPEADGTLAWTKTTVVVVTAAVGDATGLGWTYSTGACKTLVDDLLAPTVVGRSAFDIPGAWSAMVRQCRNFGRPGVVSAAIAAVDIALWDLKARLLGLPLCSLLGMVRPAVPVYGSGGFTSYDDDTMRRQLDGWVHEQGIPRVKIKIGESWGSRVRRDLARVALAREAIGSDAELYVDANGGYTPGQAVRVGARLADWNVTWFEEPVTSDDLPSLAAIRGQVLPDVAAGEYGSDLGYFRRMCEAGAIDCLQVDVTRCAGITEWLRVAAVAAAFGLEVSGHTAPNLHAHPACAVENLRHLEYFHDHVRVEEMLFDGALDPAGGTIRPDQGRTGIGMAIRQDAARHRIA